MIVDAQDIYVPGDLIRARTIFSPATFKVVTDVGLVLAVVYPNNVDRTDQRPSYLVLWEKRGLVEHTDGHLSDFGTRLLRRDT